MCDGMTEDAETDRRLEFLAAEALKVSERVNFFHVFGDIASRKGAFQTALFPTAVWKPPLLDVCRFRRASATVRARR
jgi:hypothetical protein